MTKKISIIGCGWLGLPLARRLVKDGHEVKGSTTSEEKIEGLEISGIEAYYVELTEAGVKGDLKACLSGSGILVLNVPPGLRRDPEKDFVKQMSFVIPYVEKSSIHQIVLISSTSVFADAASFPQVTEATIPNPDTKAGKQLLAVEQLFCDNDRFETTVLRFSGLFGDTRHPAKYLSGKTNLENPDAPVNLIHLEDCIGIITSIIEKEVWNECFNASAQPHPSKKEYYRSVCEAMGWPLPKFKTDTVSKGKAVSSDKLIRVLDYGFRVRLE